MGWIRSIVILCILMLPFAAAEEYLVLWKEAPSIPPAQGLRTAAAHIPDSLPQGVRHEFKTIPGAVAEMDSIQAAALREDPRIKAVIPNGKRKLMLTDSTAIIKATEAYLQQTGGVNLTGRGQTICILDTGVMYDHPAFAGKIVASHDFAEDDTNASDNEGHGTHVAGIAAGNSEEVRGVAPDASLIIVKVCTETCYDSDIIAGIDYCNQRAETHNISVISASLGSDQTYTAASCSSDPSYPAFELALQASLDAGIIPVFAAGNGADASGISYPGCSPRVISVGSTTKADAISWFSNRGNRLDIYAPGSDIVSAATDGGTTSMSGTSMATPHVAGMIAILTQQETAANRTLTLARAKEALNISGSPIDARSRIDIANALIYLKSSYLLNRSTGALVNRSTGTTLLIGGVNITDTECITLEENLVSIDSEACPQYNTSANITITGLQVAAIPMRNGATCSEEICTAINYTNGTLSFSVSGFSNYSAQEIELLDLQLSAPGQVVKGREFNMSINISNAGRETAQNTTLMLNFTGDLVNASHQFQGTTIVIGNVEVNETIMLNATLRASTDMQNGTTAIINATAAYYASTGAIFNKSNATSLLVLGVPNITLDIEDTPDPAPGDVNYTITVSNTGDETAYDVLLSITPDADLTLLNVSLGSEDNHTFDLGNMSPNTTLQLAIAANFTSNDALIMRAAVNYTYENKSYTRNEEEQTQLPRAPSARSGGGGGGGGAPAARTYTLGNSTAPALYRGDKIIFTVDDSQHTLTLIDIFRSSARISVASMPQEFNLTQGDSIKVEFGRNQVSSVRISLINLSYPKAFFTIEPLPAPPEAQANEQSQAQNVQVQREESGKSEAPQESQLPLEAEPDAAESLDNQSRTLPLSAQDSPAPGSSVLWIWLSIIICGVLVGIILVRRK